MRNREHDSLEDKKRGIVGKTEEKIITGRNMTGGNVSEEIMRVKST